jgi:hypothetical protein
MKALIVMLAVSLFALTECLSGAEPPATELPDEADTWMLAYFRQRYDSRVEIDAAGRTQNVPLPNPMRVERLHLALSTDGRHWTPLNDNQPVWDHWLRDPVGNRRGTGRSLPYSRGTVE